MTPISGIALALAASALTSILFADDYQLSGPYTHENLSIFLIQGPNRTSKRYLTLQEALEQKKAVVYETKQVNELAIENLSKTEEIYLQSGDIVKGGQQDRTVKDDLIIPTSSGRIPISAFCVEHGRWSRRDGSSVTQFDSSNQAVASREMKKAVKLSSNQSEVWAKVSEMQGRLSDKLKAPVAAPASPTSYMLSLETPQLQKSVDEYLSALRDAVNRRSDFIGFAFTVNGKLSSADVYGSHELFLKLWPKLLRAAAVEAVAELEAGRKFESPAPAKIRAQMADAERAPAQSSDLTARVRAIRKESAANAMFETEDRAAGSGWIHRNYLVK